MSLGIGIGGMLGSGGGGIIAGRVPFEHIGSSQNAAWFFTDDLGNAITVANANQSGWTAQDTGTVSIEFNFNIYTKRIWSSGNFYVGFDEELSPTNSLSQFTGFYYDSSTILRFIESGVDMGVIANPTTDGYENYRVERDVSDGLFRAYRGTTLIYTSAYSSVGGVFPWIWVGLINKVIKGIFVTS